MRGAHRFAFPLLLLAAACTSTTREPASARAGDATAALDSLNGRLSAAYRTRDPVAYGALFTDSAQFEWPQFTTVRGRAGLEAMARTNWAALRDMDLAVHVTHRRIAPDHATEFGAFEQSYADSSGARFTEYGRYVSVLVPGANGRWEMDRFFGFSDSTRPAPAAAR